MLDGRVVVVTDSAASIPPKMAQRLGIVVVPVRVTIGDQTFPEGVKVSGARVLDAITAGEDISTAAPTVETMVETYRRCASAGAGAIVSVHVAAGLSRTHAIAAEAAAAAPVPTTVVDSGTIAMGQGFAALAAGALAVYGADPEECAEAALAVAESVHFTFTVDTLEYLRRGGRVSSMVAALGTLLSIRPVMSVGGGGTQVVDRIRNTGPARQRVRALAQDAALDMRRPAAAVALVGGDAMAAGLGLTIAGPVYDAIPGASLTVHTGPGTYAAIVADMPDEYFKAFG